MSSKILAVIQLLFVVASFVNSFPHDSTPHEGVEASAHEYNETVDHEAKHNKPVTFHKGKAGEAEAFDTKEMSELLIHNAVAQQNGTDPAKPANPNPAPPGNSANSLIKPDFVKQLGLYSLVIGILYTTI